jgi:hypothetical protein
MYNQTSHLDDVDNKMLDNFLQVRAFKSLKLYSRINDGLCILQIVSQMYAFQMVCHDLIFDLLDNLCGSFRIKDVELILLVLKAVGFLLRKDDPTKLKTFIHKVQKKSNQDSETGKKYLFSIVQWRNIICKLEN